MTYGGMSMQPVAIPTSLLIFKVRVAIYRTWVGIALLSALNWMKDTSFLGVLRAFAMLKILFTNHVFCAIFGGGG